MQCRLHSQVIWLNQQHTERRLQQRVAHPSNQARKKYAGDHQVKMAQLSEVEDLVSSRLSFLATIVEGNVRRTPEPFPVDRRVKVLK
jgi:hypothetical protein